MKPVARADAENMRREGRSIKEISRLLGVSQSSTSRWCKDIGLSATQRSALDTRGRAAGIAALLPINERRRRAKQVDIETQGRNGMDDVGTMTHRDLLMLGLGLYWGEGYKRGSLEWGFTNSDPQVIRFIIVWLEHCYGIHPGQMGARVTINVLYRNESERLHREWSVITGISRANFSAPSFITGYGKPGGDPRTYRGTLRIKVRRSTSLRRRILASIVTASNQSIPNSRKTAS